MRNQECSLKKKPTIKQFKLKSQLLNRVNADKDEIKVKWQISIKVRSQLVFFN